MKSTIRKIIISLLAWQVKRLRTKNNFKVIAVAGSVGKTSTKLAIANVLSQKYKVQYQEGNYNDIVSVPLIYFGHVMPSVANPLAWLKILLKNEKIISKKYPYKYVVLELGTDGPGQIKAFKKYVDADIGVLTAISPEHMEFFDSLDEVAEEELAIVDLCKQLIINKDLCSRQYTSRIQKPFITYAVNQAADYQLTNLKYKDNYYDFDVLLAGKTMFSAKHEAIAETQLYSLCASISIAHLEEVSVTDIEKGIGQIRPVNGRMQHLKGINHSQIIDDTYNASPDATKAALDTLYKINSEQRIAILGNMNELGDFSKQAHTDIGNYCDPKYLALVVTIGPDANKFLAEAAKEKGCKVKTFSNPYEAGEYLKGAIKPGAVVLAKGSQNGVFAEETVKKLLANSRDSIKLVRQSERWLKIKTKQFK